MLVDRHWQCTGQAKTFESSCNKLRTTVYILLDPTSRAV